MGVLLALTSLPLDGSTASAQASGQEATRQVELGPDEEEARAHFNLAQLQYRRGRFIESAHEFEAAHALSPRPEFLYNIYISYRDGGDLEAAARALRELLGEANMPARLSRELLSARYEVLEEQIAERRELEAAARTPEPQTLEPEPEPEPAPAPEPGGLWTPGFAVLGAGLGLAAVGAVLGGVALSMYADVEARCTNGICPADTEADRSTGQALTLTTDVLIPLGVAAAVTGLVLALVIGPDEEPAVALSLGPDLALLTLRGDF